MPGTIRNDFKSRWDERGRGARPIPNAAGATGRGALARGWAMTEF